MCNICVVQHIEVCANLSLEFIFLGIAAIPAQSLKKRRKMQKRETPRLDVHLGPIPVSYTVDLLAAFKRTNKFY